MQKTNQTNQLDGKKTHKHPLEEEESLQRKAEEHVSNYFATLGNVGGEGNGTPLQYSCLENPRDGGAWWAAISGVAQSRTRLK